jgi:Tfp pilus assembly protein PilV
MSRALHSRFGALDREAGVTMVEVLVATVMSLVVVGGATAMLISAVRAQPQQSKQAENITTARWQLDRITRELRDGISITAGHAKTNEVSFLARVRHTSCGGGVPTSPSATSIVCQVTYTCTSTSCTRIEANEGTFTGTPETIVTGINTSAVFCFVPSTNTDPTECGPAQSATTPTYVGATLHVPNPAGSGALTVSDGASLRSATLSY